MAVAACPAPPAAVAVTGFQGGSSRAWLLSIVRNSCYTFLRQNRAGQISVELDDDLAESPTPSFSPELALAQRASQQQLRAALEQLPVEFRELIVLREVEGLSYKEIAGIAGIPLGTVMSRLARARAQLRQCLLRLAGGEQFNEM